MKIIIRNNNSDERVLSCPDCQSTNNWKNSTYTRKWFHTYTDNQEITHKVQRYLCQNPYCPRRTFSVLPQEVIPYCRFLWLDMIKVSKAITEGKSYYYIAHNLFTTAIANCVRLGKTLSCLTSWIYTLCQEHDGFNHISSLESGVNFLMQHHSWIQLKHMWSRFYYPKTFLKGVINIV